MQNLFKKIDEGVKAVFESDSYKDCLRYMSKFTNYSAGNCILIMLQKPDASLVAAFGKWKELGRTINKGEKGIAILAPMSFKSKELKEQSVKDSSGNQVYNADGSEKKEKVEVEQTSIGFKKVYGYAAMKVNAAEEDFELMELFGQTVLFTNMRVDRSTVPEGLYAYDARHDDDCTGEICEIKPSVMVNHWGTIICKEPIEMDEFWHSKFVDKDDYSYLGDSVKLDEYINTDYSEEESAEMEM